MAGWRPIWNVHQAGVKALCGTGKLQLLKQQFAHVPVASTGIVQMNALRQHGGRAARGGRNHMQFKFGSGRRQVCQQAMQVLARTGCYWFREWQLQSL